MTWMILDDLRGCPLGLETSTGLHWTIPLHVGFVWHLHQTNFPAFEEISLLAGNPRSFQEFLLHLSIVSARKKKSLKHDFLHACM